MYSYKFLQLQINNVNYDHFIITLLLSYVLVNNNVNFRVALRYATKIGVSQPPFLNKQ